MRPFKTVVRLLLLVWAYAAGRMAKIERYRLFRARGWLCWVWIVVSSVVACTLVAQFVLHEDLPIGFKAPLFLIITVSIFVSSWLARKPKNITAGVVLRWLFIIVIFITGLYLIAYVLIHKPLTYILALAFLVCLSVISLLVFDAV